MSEKLTIANATTAVNQARAEAGLAGKIPSQMLFNYGPARVRQGKKPIGGLVVERSEDGKWMVTAESFTTWLGTYIKKQVALASI